MTSAEDKGSLPYKNTSLSFEERARDLVSRMTLKEKISQMMHKAKGIRRLGIPAYNWWNECLHGVANAGIATVFPQAIGMAATFNNELIFEIAKIISDEARAKYHEGLKKGTYYVNILGVIAWYVGASNGLTFWSPNINIFRDPRWGRGQETYGEDPYLTAEIAKVFVKGLQGDHPKYLKVVSTPKHFAVYNGPEKGRFAFDSKVSIKDLRETYLYAFKECVKEAKAVSVMGAYNRLNGIPCCANKFLLQDLLRDEWGFDGYVVSDCGAIMWNRFRHKYFGSLAQSAAWAVKNGCDLNCGSAYRFLNQAIKFGYLTEEDIDRAVIRLMKARFRLGMFDPPKEVPYASIPFELNDCPAHREMALRTARESIVLLKNQDNFLPLDKNVKTIAVIGPNANSKRVLLGNYQGTPSKSVTPLEGIKNAASSDTKVLYVKGCKVKRRIFRGFSKALKIAKQADVVIMCMGINQSMEREDLLFTPYPDRRRIELPSHQEKLIKLIHTTGKPIVLVLLSGSAITVPWAAKHVPAILKLWYPGEEGGTALADVLFDDYSPAGRLPVTVYKSTVDLPPITDVSMKGRTYRYIETDPLYPFGYGLSYTKFKYSNFTLSASEIKAGDGLDVTVDIENIGDHLSDEVVQLYLKDLEASVTVPHHQLQGFKRIALEPGEKKTVSFRIASRQMALITNEGKCVLEPGKFKIFVGGCQPDKRSRMLMGNVVLEDTFEVTGKQIELEY
ncbi:MAG: glycoside hydrolase family 3 C-terminal domain-containing protein [Candidatus Helarchaeota archaeon]|nr:glycoside hydrolase family 3 C-terminal domain-containing protein [Candidatus Helarchaeota archaeon]